MAMEIRPESQAANKSIFLIVKNSDDPLLTGYRVESCPWVTKVGVRGIRCPTTVDWVDVVGRRGGPITLHSFCKEARSIASFERARKYFPDRKIDPNFFLPPDGHIVKIYTKGGRCLVGFHHVEGWYTKTCRVREVAYWTPRELWSNYETYGVVNECLDKI